MKVRKYYMLCELHFIKCLLYFSAIFDTNNKIYIFEQNERMNITFPGMVTDSFGEWKIHKLTAMIGSQTNVFSFEGNIRYGIIEAPIRIPTNFLTFEYQIDILYYSNTLL